MTDQWSVHDQPDFARTYDEDETVTIRMGDLRALLDVGTGSMDFGSGMLDNEQVEVLRTVAVVLGIDPNVVTPRNFECQYIGHHEFRRVDWTSLVRWHCDVCGSNCRNDPPESDRQVEK